MIKLIIGGKNFNPDDFLAKVRVKPSQVKYKGDPKFSQTPVTSKMKFSYVSINISKSKNAKTWKQKARLIEKFLINNFDELKKVLKLKFIESRAVCVFQD